MKEVFVFGEAVRGKHFRPYVLDDENCRRSALAWLHERAYDKGQPSIMTATTFANWVNVDCCKQLSSSRLSSVFYSPHIQKMSP